METILDPDRLGGMDTHVIFMVMHKYLRIRVSDDVASLLHRRL